MIKLKDLIESIDWDKKYSQISGNIDGLTIRNQIPNTSSISSSFNNYKILKGIRKISINEFNANPHDLFYAKDDIDKCKQLAEKIKNSKEINPLIVAIDNEGPYILEGGHRLGALYLLKVKYIPALVVLDLDLLKRN